MYANKHLKKTATGKISESAAVDRHWRIYFLVFFVLIVGGVITARLYFIQVLANEKFVFLAKNQHEISSQLEAERGEIFLKDGAGTYPLAVNREYQMAFAVPEEIVSKEEAASKIVEILQLERDEVLRKISKEKDLFEILKHKLSSEEIAKLKNAKISGVYLVPEHFRFYPGGELGAHIVGFVGSDGEKVAGRYGLEAYWDKELQGKSGSVNQERDAAGRWISLAERDIEYAENGVDLVLTIEHPVQYEVEKIIKEAVEKNQADSGTIVVMEPQTGKILAMAGAPGFDPNDYSKVEDMAAFVNAAVSVPYESGSVFKPITMAAGIDDGKIQPETTFVDSGSIASGGYVIKNSEGKVYGKQTMTQVLEQSINTGVIYVEKQLGNKKFADYVKRFGLGEKTGIGLPADSGGQINNLEELRKDLQFYTASFGQGITMTPLQLAAAYAVIGNGGRLMQPQIVEKIIYADGKEERIEPVEVRRVISADTAKKVARMLRSVVVNGHGKRADVPGYLVGGKTGTAEVAKTGAQGYEDGLTIGSFAGLAPIDDPRFVVVVKIVNPKDVQWAESTAAPAFGRVMKFLLEYYKVKPTEY